MFEGVIERGPHRPLLRYVVFAAVAHALVLALLLRVRAEEHRHRDLAVVFRAISTPPAPPPPAPARAIAHKAVVGKKIERPRPVVIKPPEPKPLPKPEPKPEPVPEVAQTPEPTPATSATAASGPVVAGAQTGGVQGGVAGGEVGGKVGAPPKPKNVAAFVIQRDVIEQPAPRLSEVFKQAHRGQGTVVGMYKVCVGTDGHVFDVIAVKSVPGADSDIIEGIKEGWVYKPQQVPVCFLYNTPITIQG
jgi:protein TonB